MVVVFCEKDSIPPPPYFAPGNYNPRLIEDDAQSSLSITPSQSVSRVGSAMNLRSLSASQASGSNGLGLSSNWGGCAPALPSHLLLLIVYGTLPQPGEIRYGKRETLEDYSIRMTRTLYWMAFCLRAVDRGFYLASMHVLRSTFLSYYMKLVKFSSDPFPRTSLPSEASGSSKSSKSSTSILRPQHTESEVLDLYILHRLHEDVFADDSSLHTERTDTLRDLFSFMQPRARLSDLVREYGSSAGLIAVSEQELEASGVETSSRTAENGSDTRSMSSLTLVPPGPTVLRTSRFTSPSQTKVFTNPHLRSLTKQQYGASMSSLHLCPVPSPSSSSSVPKLQNHVTYPRKVLHAALRVSFSPRRVGLIYAPQKGQGKTRAPRTILELERKEDEALERTASRLVTKLKTWIESGGLAL